MGAEQQSHLATAQRLLHRLVRDAGTGEETGVDLFAIADLLQANQNLLRGLTDPGRSEDDRAALATAVFSDHVHSIALWTIEMLSAMHWGHPRELIATVAELGLDSFVLAENADENPDLCQQLVDAYTLINSNRELRIELSDIGLGGSEQRAELAGRLFEGHVTPIAKRLIMRASANAQLGHLVKTLRIMASRAAEMNGKMLVICTTARPLTPQQASRMAALATRKWNRPVDMAYVVDPDLIGGFRLDVGEEAIDTSIRSDLALAHEALVR